MELAWNYKTILFQCLHASEILQIEHHTKSSPNRFDVESHGKVTSEKIIIFLHLKIQQCLNVVVNG